MAQIRIRGKIANAPNGSKADIARYLLTEGYSVNEISKAVPMAYSQVHQLNQKRPKPSREDSLIRAHGMKPQEADRRLAWTDPQFGKRQPTKPSKSPMVSRSRVGKLRVPGLSSDVAVGECVNCGHDLVVRPTPTGFVLIHVNTSAEEYLAVTQFCLSVPKVLLP